MVYIHLDNKDGAGNVNSFHVVDSFSLTITRNLSNDSGLTKLKIYILSYLDKESYDEGLRNNDNSEIVLDENNSNLDFSGSASQLTDIKVGALVSEALGGTESDVIVE